MRFCEVCGAAFQYSRTCPRDGVPVRAGAFDPFIGRVLGGRYRILERIGAGSMGQVYRAAHTRIACTFAVKVVWGDVAYDPAMQARFAREAEVASCLQSRYIVRVVDFATDDGSAPYLVMEFLDGPTLHDVLERDGGMAPARVARIAQRIALGLAHAHDRGVVHRDLKPENVLLAHEDEEADVVKLLDFGVARLDAAERLTSSGMALGTPLYMAPEQVRAEAVDGRTDLYALGVVLFEMLTGKPPFDAPTLEGLLRAHITTPPPSLRASLEASRGPPELDGIVQRLLAKRPDDRFASAREVVHALGLAIAPPVSRPTFAPASMLRPSAPSPIVTSLERAILIGAPLYNAGDHAGCYQVYRAEAERLLAAGCEPAVADRLRAGLLRAAGRPDATDAAWDLRHAFDDLLATQQGWSERASSGSASGQAWSGVADQAAGSAPLSIARTGLAASALRADLRAAILRAIQVGAPAFNEGRHDTCAQLYREAAQGIVGLASTDAGAQPVEQHLRRALAAAAREAPTEAAWTLRRAFDAVLSLD